MTSYGYHIIKRLHHKPFVADTNNTQLRDDIKLRITQSDRMEVSQKMLLKRVMRVTGYKKSVVNEKHLYVIIDSILQNKRFPVFADINAKTPLLTFTKKTITVKDFQTYLETVRGMESMRLGKSPQQLIEDFFEVSAFDYYRQHLEEYNKDFAYQLNEFKEGNLLFEIMQRNIWDPASVDSAGLKNYYDAHKSKYLWESSADAIIAYRITCPGRRYLPRKNEREL